MKDRNGFPIMDSNPRFGLEPEKDKKVSISFNLLPEIIGLIEEFQEDHSLKSKSQAVRIIFQREQKRIASE